VLDVLELASVLKSCLYAVPIVVRLTVPAAIAGCATPTSCVHNSVKTATARSHRQRPDHFDDAMASLSLRAPRFASSWAYCG
jgi:hypothetical protein